MIDGKIEGAESRRKRELDFSIDFRRRMTQIFFGDLSLPAVSAEYRARPTMISASLETTRRNFVNEHAARTARGFQIYPAFSFSLADARESPRFQMFHPRFAKRTECAV